MSDTLVYTKTLGPAEIASSQLRQEYETRQALFDLQPAAVKRFLLEQAKQIAEGLVQASPQIRFTLPEFVTGFADLSGNKVSASVPAKHREQRVGSFLTHLRRADTKALLMQRLAQLEGSPNPVISLSGALIRHSTASYILHDHISHFYQPHWAAFDERGNLLASTVTEVEAHIADMQCGIELLRFAVRLLPDMVADKEYLQKDHGLRSQLIAQGSALARYQTQQIIQRIKLRAGAGRLDRGFSLSLPFFDDQNLAIQLHHFTVIPSGRVMFSPDLVALAAWKEQVHVAQNTSLNPTTRSHLVEEIRLLEEAFYSCDRG